MRVMIMAGGTGGHVFPGLAVAHALRAQNIEVFWLGTREGLEAEIVPRAGIDMEWISINGLRGKGLTSWLLAPGKLTVAMHQALQIIRRRRPAVVLGMGGFVTGPGGVVARMAGKSLIIHEQNAVAGLTNRLLAPLASRVLEAFPGTFGSTTKAVATGNPVRLEIAAIPDPEQRFAERSGAVRLLIIGGSLGAKVLNEVVPQAIAKFSPSARPVIWHQAGSRNIDEAQANYQTAGVEARVEPFIADMAQAYAWADLVICRAGALTVSELAAAGVGSILIPYMHAVDDHQTRNAAYLVDQGAAMMIAQPRFNAETMYEALAKIFAGANSAIGGWSAVREKLLSMAVAARQLAKPSATEQVAGICLEVARV